MPNYLILGTETSKASKNFKHALLTSKPSTMTQSAQATISSIVFWKDIKYKLYFFSWQKQHFKELGISFSYLVLQLVLRWCSAKTGLLQKAVFIDVWNLVFVCHWSESLKKTSEWRFFSWFEAVKTATLWINGFLHNNFTRI